MATFDVELVSLPAHVPSADIAYALDASVDEVTVLAARLPAVVGDRLDDTDAERLFHALRELGAEVQLRPVAGPPSRRPSAGPISSGSMRPYRPSTPPPSARPSARPSAPELGVLAGAESEPLGGALDLPGLELDLPQPPPRRPAPVSSSAPRREPLPEAPAGEARGTFIGSVLRAYAYPFTPTVLLSIGLLALVLTFINVTFRSWFTMSVTGWFIRFGMVAAWGFAVIRHASMGRSGVPTGDGGATLTLAAGQGIALFLPLSVLNVVASEPATLNEWVDALVHPFSMGGAAPGWLIAVWVTWTVYLPAALILAATNSSVFGGLNVPGGVQMIARLGGPYAIVLAAFLPLALVGIILSMFAGFSAMAGAGYGLGVLILLSLVLTLAHVYVVTVGARLMGGLLYHYGEELGMA